MKDSPGLHLKTYIFIFFMVLFAPLGNVLLSKGMKGVGSAKNWAPGEILHVLGSIMTSGYIWLGIGCLLTFFVAYMLVLTWADYSYVQPASSFSYAVVAMLGYFLLSSGDARDRKRELRRSRDGPELRGWRCGRNVVLARTHQYAALGRGPDCLRGCRAGLA